jgi:hypothetical protein
MAVSCCHPGCNGRTEFPRIVCGDHYMKLPQTERAKIRSIMNTHLFKSNPRQAAIEHYLRFLKMEKNHEALNN